jgi:hypothetical protein
MAHLLPVWGTKRVFIVVHWLKPLPCLAISTLGEPQWKSNAATPSESCARISQERGRARFHPRPIQFTVSVAVAC